MSKEFFEAIQSGDAQKVESMLQADGSLAEARNEQGVSAILLALYSRKQDIAQRLGELKSELDLHDAAALGRTQRVADLLESSPESVGGLSPDGFTPLHYAAFFSRPEATRILLSKGSDPNAVTRNPRFQVRPLHSCVAGPDVQARLAIAEALLKAGADVNARQSGGYTALHSAAMHGDLALARLLVENGADLDQASDEGKTALDFAQEHGKKEMAAWLTEQRKPE